MSDSGAVLCMWGGILRRLGVNYFSCVDCVGILPDSSQMYSHVGPEGDIIILTQN
jgi:hypothetical protein